MATKIPKNVDLNDPFDPNTQKWMAEQHVRAMYKEYTGKESFKPKGGWKKGNYKYYTCPPKMIDLTDEREVRVKLRVPKDFPTMEQLWKRRILRLKRAQMGTITYVEGQKYGMRDGRPTGIKYTYSPNSKVMPKPKGYVAVRMRRGERGWYKEGGSGYFVSDFHMQMAMRGVDYATGMDRYEKLWNSMTPEQKARFMEKSAGIDWDTFWEEHYDPNTGLLSEEGQQIIEDIISYAMG